MPPRSSSAATDSLCLKGGSSSIRMAMALRGAPEPAAFIHRIACNARVRYTEFYLRRVQRRFSAGWRGRIDGMC